MKKFIALFLAIVSITVVICSCGNSRKTIETQTDTNGEIVTTTTKEQATTKVTIKETTGKATETTKKKEIIEPQISHYSKTGSTYSSAFIQMPSRVIMVDRILSYYSKADGGYYTFCFDPLCDHKSQNCIAQKFQYTNGSASLLGIYPVYSEYTNRFYLPRVDNIFSSKFDGTDIKNEVSLGEGGFDLSNRAKTKDENFLPYPTISNLQSYDNYIFFCCRSFVVDPEKSTQDIKESLWRYDLKSKNVENLFDGKWPSELYFTRDYFITDGKLYLGAVGNKYYSANLDLSDLKEVNFTLGGEKCTLSLSINRIYDGKDMFFVITSKADSGKEYRHIARFDAENNDFVILLTEEYEHVSETDFISGDMKLWVVTDEYIYYTYENPFLIGKRPMKSQISGIYDQYQYNYFHTIYRINKDGTGKTLVFEGVTSNDSKSISYEIEDIIVFDSHVIMNIREWQYDPTILRYDKNNLPVYGTWNNNPYYVVFDIAPDGSFVNMRELVLDE